MAHPFAPPFQGTPKFVHQEKDGSGEIYGHQQALDYKWIINQQINDCRRMLNFVIDTETYMYAENSVETLASILIRYIADDIKGGYLAEIERIEEEKPKLLANGFILWKGKQYPKGIFEGMFNLSDKTKLLRKKFEALISLSTKAGFIPTGRIEDEA